MTQVDPHLDTGAYALHAMPEDEASLAQEHFETCESCSAELVGFLETAALLGTVPAEAPPASLRRSIMARIAEIPQLPPLTARHAAPEIASEGGSPGRHAAPVDPPTVLRPRRWYRRPVALLAAAVAAVVLGGGAVVAVKQLTDNQQQTAQTPEQCVAQAADRKDLTPAAPGQGTITYSATCAAALLDVTGLPGLPADKTYQLWALAGDKPRSLGVLPDASAGKGQVITAQPQPGETVVAITAEPAGGSPAPTLPILWQATLAS